MSVAGGNGRRVGLAVAVSVLLHFAALALFGAPEGGAAIGGGAMAAESMTVRLNAAERSDDPHAVVSDDAPEDIREETKVPEEPAPEPDVPERERDPEPETPPVEDVKRVEEPTPDKRIVEEPEAPAKPRTEPRPEPREVPKRKMARERKAEAPTPATPRAAPKPEPRMAAPEAERDESPRGEQPRPDASRDLAARDTNQVGGDDAVPVVRSADFAAPPQAPRYPPLSMQRDEEGTVIVRALVVERGPPSRVTVWRSSGYHRLDESAVDAVRQWQFRPMRRGGAVVTAWVEIPVRFRLR